MSITITSTGNHTNRNIMKGAGASSVPSSVCNSGETPRHHPPSLPFTLSRSESESINNIKPTDTETKLNGYETVLLFSQDILTTTDPDKPACLDKRKDDYEVHCLFSCWNKSSLRSSRKTGEREQAYFGTSLCLLSTPADRGWLVWCRVPVRVRVSRKIQNCSFWDHVFCPLFVHAPYGPR